MLQTVLIYGAGRTGVEVAKKCADAGISIKVFLDMAADGECCGISVVKADDIPEIIDRELPVILALHHGVHDAVQTLSSAGFSKLITLAAFNAELRRCKIDAITIGPLFDLENFADEQCFAAEAANLLTDERSKEIFKNHLRYLRGGSIDALERKDSGIMYFPDNRPFEFSGKVTMADCGSYIGDTIMSLMPYVEFEKIYAFDPDPLVASQLRENLSRYKGLDFHIIQAGLGSCRGQIAFAEDGTGRGVIREDGGIKIDIVTLDEVFSNVKVDFIKMDIEGAEADALLGAANVIKRDMPLLEVSVYHRPGDFWKLPLLIKELNPEYSIYLRCGDDSFHDTVAVAVPKRFKLR